MLIRRVEIAVLDHENRKTIKRYRVYPKQVEGIKHICFTPSGADEALELFISKFDDANPNHRYRLVSLGRYRFKLVWEPDVKSGDTQSSTHNPTDQRMA